MPKLTTFCALALAGLVAAAPAGDALAQSKPTHRHRDADKIFRAVDR